MSKDSRDTKTEIFYAAAILFSEKGYSHVSMRDISKKVGIKASSIYNHYKSKEEILDLLLDYYLERMEKFYKRMREASANISTGQPLENVFKPLMLTYHPEERELMYHLTRIVHHEQFHFQKAGDALIGGGYRKYVEEHVQFFNRLSENGYLAGKEHNQMYGELVARVSLTFATQFLHPEITPTIENQQELYQLIILLIMNYEKNFLKD